MDIWAPHHRGIAVVGYSITLIGGPTIGPIVGGVFIASGHGWRWTEYITGIVMLTQFAINVFVVDESYSPALLTIKAHKLRYQGNWALHAKVRLLKMTCTVAKLCSMRSGMCRSRSCHKNTLSDRSKCWLTLFASWFQCMEPLSTVCFQVKCCYPC